LQGLFYPAVLSLPAERVSSVLAPLDGAIIDDDIFPETVPANFPWLGDLIASDTDWISISSPLPKKKSFFCDSRNLNPGLKTFKVRILFSLAANTREIGLI